MGTNKAAATKRSLHFGNSWNSGLITLTCFGNAVYTRVCIQVSREKRQTAIKFMMTPVPAIKFGLATCKHL